MYTQNQDIAVNFPNDLLEEMKIEEVFFSPLQRKIGVAALSSKENGMYVLRLYQLFLNNSNDMYDVTQELAAFSFYTRKELDDLRISLPQMTAFEFLMLINPISKHA